MGWRSAGGVWSRVRSRIPVRLISRVRGIGVAVRVSTSTSVRSFLMASLWVHAEALLLVDDQQARGP